MNGKKKREKIDEKKSLKFYSEYQFNEKDKELSEISLNKENIFDENNSSFNDIWECLCKLMPINFSVESNDKIIEIKIKMDLTDELNIEFIIKFNEDLDYFEFIPNKINFEFLREEDKIFNEELDIKNKHLNVFLNHFLELKNSKYIKKQ